LDQFSLQKVIPALEIPYCCKQVEQSVSKMRNVRKTIQKWSGWGDSNSVGAKSQGVDNMQLAETPMPYADSQFAAKCRKMQKMPS
jgi:hypothetical protein